MTAVAITPIDTDYPRRLRARLGTNAPSTLWAAGNIDLLSLPMTGLFCSAKCPGDAILRAHDQAVRWRSANRCVISGFHSPVEQECLRILLRGKSPVVICPARGLPQRIPPEWQHPMATGQMLILTPFPVGKTRVTAALATRRNEFVAALADELWFGHIAPGGHMEKLAHRAREWN